MRQITFPTTSVNFKDKFCKIPETGIKLNIGCGVDYLDGFINLDGNSKIKADIYHDLDRKHLHLPFETGSIDFVLANHVLEHIVYLVQLKKELGRIMRVGGTMTVVVPNYLSMDAWGDDTHVRAFSPHSFMEIYWDDFKINDLVMSEHTQLGSTIKLNWLIANLTRVSREEKESIIQKINKRAEELLNGGTRS